MDLLKDDDESINKEINRLKSEIKKLEIKHNKLNQDNNYKIKKSKKDYDLEEIKKYVIDKCPVYVHNPNFINESEEKISRKILLKIILNYVMLYKDTINKKGNNIKLIEEEKDKLVYKMLKENKCKNIKSNRYKYKQMLTRCAYLEEKYQNKLEYCDFNVHYIGRFSHKEWYIWLEYFDNLL